MAIPGAKPRAILTMLGLHAGSVVSADAFVELLWGEDPPRTAARALQTHISSLRRTLGEGVVLTEGSGWTLAGAEIDASRYKAAARLGRDAVAAGDTSQAVTRFHQALALWRGTPELPAGQRGSSEKTRWLEAHAALVEDRADALLATGRAAEIIGELEAAVADAPLRERRWGQLMLALYRAGRQGEALAAYQRARSLLADQLGVDPGPGLRRLEAAIVAQDAALDTPVAQQVSSITRAVTFLLTDIEGSTAAWEAQADAMAAGLARHDELVEQVVTSRGGRLVKTRGEGDATFSVFERPSAAAAAAIELQDAITHEPWALREPMRIRVALHTGEVELRDGDYFGRAVNRAARLRSLAAGGQILCSGATAELVIDSLSDDVLLADLGMRQLRNLPRPEHVFELRLESVDDRPQDVTLDAPLQRPELPAVLTGKGPFVGRGRELARLLSGWQAALTGGTGAVLIAGEPGVGKTRLAGEWSQQAYEQGAVVLYGRCDEDLGAPHQPFAEALRSLVPSLGAERLRGLRGVEALLPLVPGLTDVVPDISAPTRADPDTERYALFDAVVAVLEVASSSAPVVLVLDDLHWAAKPTLLLLRHLLRFGERGRVQIIGTYRSTDLDRSHPLAAMLADLHRDGTADRLSLSGLDIDDVSAYVAEAGYDDEELARALASVTGGNPFFLIEALRHVDESGGVWDQSTLPQGVREAVSRRLSRLPVETNKALAAAAVVGSRFAVELVERIVDQDLVDAFDEACKAGIVIEEPGGHYRFNHALIRQSLLAELPSVRRMRLHQRIAATLESEPGADDELLADLAHHYFECAWAGNAAKAVEYCRRAADQAMARLAYEGAADLYDHALHALEELDEELPDRDDQTAELLVARCEALLAAGDMASATGAVARLQDATRHSARLAAWATCFDGQLSILTQPERLDEIEAAVGAAADKLAELDDAGGEAKAHTVRAECLARLGRVGDCEIALDHALTAARRAHEHRRVNAVLAGAPLAALWGPSPVPRAGGRCLDVVRLLRITTDSPAVEATSTRCQAVLEAFRGRAAAARRMIESARRTVTELGLRHALLEVEQFAGIVEMVIGDAPAAEVSLRKAYNGFRRMGLDADTAETAALLGRACLELDRDAEADELCVESQRRAGHALKAAIAWRTLRAQLLSRNDNHDEARRVAAAAVSLAARTDGLVDHGDACLALATVLYAAGDAAGARAAAERAVALYDQKGAAALVEKARAVLGGRPASRAPAPPEAPSVEVDNECVRAIRRGEGAVQREEWDEVEKLFSTDIVIESRRKITGFTLHDVPSGRYARESRSLFENEGMRVRIAVVAVRGERLALTRLQLGTADVSPGAPRDELLHLFGIDRDGRIALQISFDIDDIDAAMAELEETYARLEQEQPKARALANAASRVVEHYLSHFATRDWDIMAEALAVDLWADDRRHVVNTGVRGGRADEIKNVQVIAELGCVNISNTPIATRGEHLVLSRHTFTVEDQLAPIHNEMIDVVEINDDNQIAFHVIFDPDDIDAAFEELDARFLAGEAAAHAGAWSLIAQTFSAIRRRDLGGLPSVTADYHIVDHRLGAKIDTEDLNALFGVTWDLTPDIDIYIEAVHRLDDVGAVITQAAYGTSEEGFDAQWRIVQLLTVEGRLGSRCELFDEADLDQAIARFDELHSEERRLVNTASRKYKQFLAHFAVHDWDSMAELLADDSSTDDRRRVVNAGIRGGRDVEISDMRALAKLGVDDMTADALAIRGERLLLCRVGSSAFQTEVLNIVEIDGDDTILAVVGLDADDFEAAIEELDARYLAGEAAVHAHTWSLITELHAAFNRHELHAITPNYVDHRSLEKLDLGDPVTKIRTTWESMPDLRIYIEAVHHLSDFGAVVTQAAHGATRTGFEAEWRVIELQTVENDRVSHAEIFDEEDLDKALARFDQLHSQERRLQNAATRWVARYLPHFATRDWDTMAEMLADDICTDDRRRVVNAGVVHGRDIEMASVRAIAEAGTENVTSTAVATRGERLLLHRVRFFIPDWPEELNHEVLEVLEVTAAGQALAHLVFDPDDFEAAIEELDARYLAGGAAAHAHAWSVIAEAHAAFNRRELPTITPDFLDHRPLVTVETGDPTARIHEMWEFTPDLELYVEAVHRLSDRGAVFTQASHGTSRAGFEAEWRVVEVVTVRGESVTLGELFDETDLDTALARFDELNRPTRRLENAASQVYERFKVCFAARNWEAVVEILADGIATDDRRRVVNAGVRVGRDAVLSEVLSFVEFGSYAITSDVIATRGTRLILNRSEILGENQRPLEFDTRVLEIIEIDVEGRIIARVVFDSDDVDAAFAELDARYHAGEAAAHSRTWSVVLAAQVALDCRLELPATTPDSVNIDHRRGIGFAPGDMTAYVRALWDNERDVGALRARIEAVHRLNDIGAVFVQVLTGSSTDGFDAEWRLVELMTVNGELISRAEIFDEVDLDAALAKFDELTGPTPLRLDNAANQVYERFWDSFAARDWEAAAEMLASDHCSDDRRRVVGAGIRNGRDAMIDDMRSAAAAFGAMKEESVVVATRGDRLALRRTRITGTDQRPEAFHSDVLNIVEIDAAERIVALVWIDSDDIDAAMAELDARYIAGEAAPYANMWSEITNSYATLNRREIPSSTGKWVTIDHRVRETFEAENLTAYIRSGWDVIPGVMMYVEAVHRLSHVGAVLTHAACGTSDEGFDAEWRMVSVMAYGVDDRHRCELFDEADVDAALARFDELNTQN